VLRPATLDDVDFLWSMLGHASEPEGTPKPRAEMEADEHLSRYVAGWGRAGDVGLVAVDEVTGGRLGAAWYRTYPADAPGYGFIDEATPEIAIACTEGARGRGLGHQLIAGLLARAHGDGLPQLSLSVRVTNAPAVRVYEDEGFVGVQFEEDGIHLTMVAPTRPETPAGGAVVVRAVAPGALDRSQLPPSAWGEVVARLDELVDLAGLPAFVAEVDGAPAGLLTWHHDPERAEVEVVGLEAWVRDRGVGAALLRTVRSEARRLGARRLWLITNNDNTDALRFYQRRGWRIVAVHPGACDRSRVLKPSIPLVGDHGIPLHDELELEYREVRAHAG
jgi:ribosomal protein S18 acetylase RimI-like enzyme